MAVIDDIAWFKNTFADKIVPLLRGTPIPFDLERLPGAARLALVPWPPHGQEQPSRHQIIRPQRSSS